jgi:uncharacterized membrane protein YkgB
MDTGSLGRMLVAVGVVIVLIGALLTLGPRIPWLGRLPGDLSFGGPRWKVYVPLGTSIVLSLLLTLIVRFFSRK